jgi:hypothetical protein
MLKILNALIRTLPHGGRVYQTPRMCWRGIGPIPQWMVPDWLHRLIERRYRRRYPWLFRRTVSHISTPTAASFISAAAASQPRSASVLHCAPANSALGIAAAARQHTQTNREMIMTHDKTGVIVTLTDDEIERCENFARELVAHYSSGETMSIMPWSRDKLSDDELRQWLASRKEAGQVIDIESCELGWWYAETLDPYGIYKALGEFPEEYSCVGRERFVRSPESNGWISEGDLPKEKLKALRERIKRAAQH